jgi:hypothetical protein
MRATEFIFSFIRRWNAGWCFCVAVLLGMFAVQGLAAVTVSHLRCENLLDPQGIDACEATIELDSRREPLQ